MSTSSYRRLRERCANLEYVNERLRRRDLILSDAWLRTTDHDYRSCACDRCSAARVAQGIKRERGQQTLRGVA